MEESVNTSNNQENSVANSDVLQTVKVIQPQMVSFSKKLDNINFWREGVYAVLTEGDRISLTAGVECRGEGPPAKLARVGPSRGPAVEAAVTQKIIETGSTFTHRIFGTDSSFNAE